MSYRKRILTLFTALAMLVSLALPAAAYGTDYLEITAGQTVTPDVNDEQCLLKFIPEADGWYGFWSTGSRANPNGTLWNDEVEINNDNGGEDMNFMIKAYLSAGEITYLRASWDWDPGVTLALHLEPLEKAEAMTLSAEAVSGYAGESCFMECDFQPMMAAPEDVTWKSSNEAVASVDLNGNIDLLAPGSATVTATSENGLTASVEVTVLEILELTDGESVVLTGDQDTVRFRFVPEATGWYYFYSTDATGDPIGHIIEADGYYVGANDDGPNGPDFRIFVRLQAGEIYALQAETGGGSCTVHLRSAVAPTELFVSEEALTGYPEHKFELDASFMPELCYSEAVTWQSSDTAVATVDEYGTVTLVSQGTAIITATSESGLTATCTVTVKGAEPLTCGTPVELNAADGVAWFSFTPETDGWYRFFSTGREIDPFALIYNEDKSELLVYSDDGEDMHFYAQCEMTAGQTYLICVDFYFYTGVCTVELEKMVSATGITLSQTHVTMDVKQYTTLEATLEPSSAIYQNITWTSSNENVVGVYYGELQAIAPGTATVTATSESGLSASCTVTVLEPVPLVCDVPQVCGSENSRYAFSFTPETDGWYGFWSTGSQDTHADLYLGQMYVNGDDDSGPDSNFLLRAQLEADKCYTLLAGPENTDTEYTLQVSTLKEPQEILLSSHRYWAYEGDYIYAEGYSLLPYPSLEQEVTWSVSDLAVADVAWGAVACLNPGTAELTVTTENGLTDSAEITVFEIPEGVDYYGSCGNTLLYTVTDGILTVTGSGEMSDSWNWENCSQAILPEGVTKIGSYSFCYSDLTSITIPSTVEKIGARAFAWSTLSEIRFLGSAPELGSGVFEEVTATAYYPANDPSWTTAVRQDYGGSITWIPEGTVQGATLSGTVTTFSEADATLELLQGNDRMVIMIVPGKTDSYEMVDLLPGNYTLKVSEEGHVTRTYQVTVADTAVTLDVKLHLPGDITGDGKVNVADTSKVYAHVRETARITDEYILACADVTGDGKINVADTSKLYAQARK